MGSALPVAHRCPELFLMLCDGCLVSDRLQHACLRDQDGQIQNTCAHVPSCVYACYVRRGEQICWKFAKWVATCCWEVRQSRREIILRSRCRHTHSLTLHFRDVAQQGKFVGPSPLKLIKHKCRNWDRFPSETVITAFLLEWNGLQNWNL